MFRKTFLMIAKYYDMMETLSTNELTITIENMDWSLMKLKIVRSDKVWMSSDKKNSIDFCKHLIELVYSAQFIDE